MLIEWRLWNESKHFHRWLISGEHVPVELCPLKMKVGLEPGGSSRAPPPPLCCFQGSWAEGCSL